MSKLASQRFDYKLPRFYYISIVLLVILICFASYYYYKEEERNFIQDKQEDLGAIADLKVNQITQWRRERLSDANYIYLNNEVTKSIKPLINNSSYSSSIKNLPTWMNAMFRNGHYERMMIIDTVNNVLAALPLDSTCVSQSVLISFDSVRVTKTIIFTEIHTGVHSNPELDIVIPIIDSSSQAEEIIAFVVLNIDPNEYLFPLIRWWPTTSKTSETVLFRRDGNDVLFISPSRSHSHEAMSMRVPLTRTSLPSVQSILTPIESIRGNDHRGVPVLASARKISGSDWHIIAKIDEEELFSPMREELYRIIVIGGAFTTLAVLMLLVFSRQQRMKYYFSLYQNESEKNVLLQKYEFLTKNANDCMFVTDENFTVVEVNKRACTLYQYTEEEFLQLDIYDLRTPEAQKEIQSQFNRLDLKKGAVYRTEHRKKDGTIFPIEVSNIMMVIDGKTFYQAIIRDLTERVIDEQKILKLNRLYATLGQINESIVRTTDKEQLLHNVCSIVVEQGEFQMAWIGTVNSAKRTITPIIIEGVLGVTLEEIAQYMKNVFDKDLPIIDAIISKKIVALSDLEGNAKLKDYQEILAQRGIKSYASVPILSNGVVVAILNVFSTEQHFIQKEEFHLLEEISEDVSFAMERIQSKEEQNLLQQQLLELQLAVDTSGEIVFITNQEGIFQYVNPAFTRLYGYSSEEVIGKVTPRILKSGKLNLELYSNFWQKLLNKEVYKGELLNKAKDGKLLNVEVSVSPIVDHHSVLLGFLAIQRDVTERKQIEEQYYRSQRLESLGTLAGGIAHDLNNVLAPIMLAVELLKKQYKGDQSQSMIETLERSAVRAKGIIQQILTFARGSDGERLELQPKYIIKEIEKIVQETFPRSIECKNEISKNLKMIVGDVTQLHQVMLNLCVNARDAMPNGGRLLLKAENCVINEENPPIHVDAKPGEYVVLSVTDTGMGMSKDIQIRIFDPFFTTKEHGKGTGLGLATVYSLVKSHGGFITVQSEPEKGSCFSVYIPAALYAQETVQGAKEEKLPVGNGEHILVVDDEASVRDITKQTLELFGYKVSQASDGTEAIAMYAKHRYSIDVVLTDIMMPIMDGYATIRALKKINPELIIIAASGLVADEEIIKTTIGTIEAFIQKPFTPAKLLVTLDTLLSARKNE